MISVIIVFWVHCHQQGIRMHDVLGVSLASVLADILMLNIFVKSITDRTLILSWLSTSIIKIKGLADGPKIEDYLRKWQETVLTECQCPQYPIILGLFCYISSHLLKLRPQALPWERDNLALKGQTQTWWQDTVPCPAALWGLSVDLVWLFVWTG